MNKATVWNYCAHYLLGAIYGEVSATPSAGSMIVTGANIAATRLY
jgi:hypothetical protein